MPAGDRRVGREHRPLARGRERRRELPRPMQRPGAASCERRQRGVALVEVDHAGLDPERAQRPDAADAEQHVLREPDVLGRTRTAAR